MVVILAAAKTTIDAEPTEAGISTVTIVACRNQCTCTDTNCKCTT